MSGLRRALVGLAVAGLALGLAALALVTTSERESDSAAWIVLALTLGWGFAGAGIFAWWRRPENRTGPLMTLVGFTWFLGALGSADAAWAYSLGLPAEPAADLGQRDGGGRHAGGRGRRPRRAARGPRRGADPALARLREGATA